jgi:hypothetical protein
MIADLKARLKKMNKMTKSQIQIFKATKNPDIRTKDLVMGG